MVVEVFEGGKEFEGNVQLRKSGSSSKFECVKSLPAESNPGRGGGTPLCAYMGMCCWTGCGF